MFPARQGNTQVYSPFGSYVVEQHDGGCPKHYLDDLPRHDVKFGKDHPLAQVSNRPQASETEKAVRPIGA
jgi:hypothetical protein